MVTIKKKRNYMNVIRGHQYMFQFLSNVNSKFGKDWICCKIKHFTS